MNKKEMSKQCSNCKILIIAIFLLSGCGEFEGREAPYILITHDAIISGFGYRCKFGVLMNFDRVNIYDKDNNPITCIKEMWLTDKQASEYKRGDL